MKLERMSSCYAACRPDFKTELQLALERVLLELARFQLSELSLESLPWTLTITQEKDLWDHSWRVQVETS